MVGNSRRPAGVDAFGSCDALYVRAEARGRARHAQRVFRAVASGDAGGVFGLRLPWGDAGRWKPPCWRRRELGSSMGRHMERCARSLAPWGSWRSPWARRGRQPEGPTRGNRTGSTGVGALAACSGGRFSQGLEGRWHAARAHAVFQRRRAPTPPPLFVRHAGARSPPSAAPHACGAAPRDRLPAAPLPAAAPADQPLASLWQQTTQRATHHQYCQAWAALTVSVEHALASWATPPDTGCGVFGRYGAASGVALHQAASMSKSKPERL